MEGVIRDRAAQFGVSYEEMEKRASSASRCTAWSAPRTSLRWGIPPVGRRSEYLRPVHRCRWQCRDLV